MAYTVSGYRSDKSFVFEKEDTPGLALARIQHFRDQNLNEITIIDDGKNQYVTEEDLEDLVNAASL